MRNVVPLKRTALTGLAILVLLLIVTSPVTTIWLIKRQADQIISDSLQGLATSSLATINVSEGYIQTALAVNGGDEAMQRQNFAKLDEATREVDSQYEAHRLTLRSDGERLEFEYLIKCRDDFRRTRKEVVDLLVAGKRTDAQLLFRSECIAKFQIYAEELGKIVEHNAIDARNGGETILRLCYILLGIQIVLLAFFFVYGFFVPFTAILERLSRKPIVFES